jgi:uncharacterized membrane protein
MGNPKQRRKKEIAIHILDILIIFYVVLLLIIIVGGGFSFTMFGSEVRVYSTQIPSFTLIVLLIIRKILTIKESFREIPVITLFNHGLNNIRTFFKISPFFFLLWILMGGYALSMSVVTVAKHFSYNTHAFDLGIFDQVLWNTINGNVLYSSIVGNRHFFGVHVSPILLLLAPLYWIYANPATLLIFQSCALASGAIPVYWFAKKKLNSEQLALLFSLIYLCYRPMRGVNLFDFHPIALTTPLLLFAFFYLDQRKYLLFGVFLALALSCKEEIATIVFIFGIYIAFIQKKRTFGFLLSLVGIAIFVLDIWVIIPHYRQAPFAVDRYSYLGNNIPEILQTLLFHPIHILKHIFISKKIGYGIELFGPVGFLSFLSLSHVFLTLPTFSQNILSDLPAQYSIHYQYTSPLTPFIFISAICGLRNFVDNPNLQRRFKLNFEKPRLIQGITIFLLFSCLLFFDRSPIYQLRKYTSTDHTKVADKLIDLIPPSVSVSAQETFVPHLSHRKHIYQFPMINEAEYIFLDVTASKVPLSKEEYVNTVSNVLQKDYGVLVAEDSFVVLKRGYSRSNNEKVVAQLQKDLN